MPAADPIRTHARRLDRLSGPAAAAALTPASIVVLPLGAIEQHGPHLPLNTDLVITETVAEAAADRVGDELDVWLLPPLAVTKSNEHAWSPGTFWLSPTTLLAVLDDIGRSLALTAAKRLVFFNGHGGNSALLNLANRELRLHHGLMTFTTHPGVPPDQGGLSAAHEHGMGVHGGHDETSLMLHVRPDLVDMSSARRSLPDHLAERRYTRFGGTVSFGWLSNDFDDSGVIGDPTEASAEHGAALFAAAVDAFAAALGEIATFEFRKPS